MKMRARVRATQWVEFDADMPDLEYEDHPRAVTSQPGQVATNEPKVLKARRDAGRQARKLAAELFPDAEILIEEVVDA